MLPTREIAYAVIAFYMGVNLLAHLDEDRTRIDKLFDLAGRFAPLASSLLPSALPH
jgi:hypothetical protein